MGVEPKELVEPIRASGRRAVIELIDSMLSRDENMQSMAKAMQAFFEKNPLLFHDMYVRPLIPKSMLEDSHGESPESVASQVRQFLKDTADIHVAYEEDEENPDERARPREQPEQPKHPESPEQSGSGPTRTTHPRPSSSTDRASNTVPEETAQ